MATVQVEAELSDIDFDDLLEEVIERIDSEHPYSKREAKLVDDLKKELSISTSMPPGDNLSDQMKMEFLMEMRDKYSEDQLREMERLFNHITN